MTTCHHIIFFQKSLTQVSISIWNWYAEIVAYKTIKRQYKFQKERWELSNVFLVTYTVILFWSWNVLYIAVIHNRIPWVLPDVIQEEVSAILLLFPSRFINKLLFCKIKDCPRDMDAFTFHINQINQKGALGGKGFISMSQKRKLLSNKYSPRVPDLFLKKNHVSSFFLRVREQK